MRAVDYGGINEREAAEVLARLALALEHEARWALRRQPPGLDVDDLKSLGRLAVLEALLTFEPGRGRHLDSWARQMIRWRLQGEVDRAHRGVPTVAMAPQDVDSFQATGSAPDARLDALEDRVAFASRWATLPPREQRAVTLRRDGAKLRTIGDDLAITPQGAGKVVRRAVSRLQDSEPAA
jgi:RNA polymerase sigma factor (sigma-70 family)